jgi:RNA polymerase sigma-70 factor (ECF subfamily)
MPFLSASSAQYADRERLRHLYEEHADMIRTLLIRLIGSQAEAEDLTQEVFLVAWKRLDLLERIPARSWLCGVAIKLSVTARRKARLRKFFSLEKVENLVDELTPDRSFEQRQAHIQVQELLSRMSEKKRTVFILFELHGMSGEEIAQALGCPIKTIWTRLFHARREFIQRLSQQQARELTLQDKEGSS